MLVNNAFSDGTHTTFAEGGLAGWRETMDVNLWGTLGLTHALLGLLEAAGDARVIMVNSMSVWKVEPGFGAYVASKGALEAVTKTLALELGGRGIRVNGVHPGYIYGAGVEWYLNHLAEERGVTFQDVYDELAGETRPGLPAARPTRWPGPSSSSPRRWPAASPGRAWASTPATGSGDRGGQPRGPRIGP